MGHHKKHRKMHGLHHRKKHRLSSSSSSSSSTSYDSDETLVKSLRKIKIEDAAEPSTFDSDFCKWKLDFKKCKHLKLKKMHKQAKKYKYYKIKQMLLNCMMGDISPEWSLRWLLGAEPFRDSKYRRQAFSLPPPEMCPGPNYKIGSEQEDAAERLLQKRFEVFNQEKQSPDGLDSLKCHIKQGNSLHCFMLTLAQEMKKLNPQMMAQAQLKILETIKMLQLPSVSESTASTAK